MGSASAKCTSVRAPEEHEQGEKPFKSPRVLADEKHLADGHKEGAPIALVSTTCTGVDNSCCCAGICDTNACMHHARLSCRSESWVKFTPMYIKVGGQFIAKDHFQEQSNPNGYINLALAENKLALHLLAPRLASYTEVPLTALGYDSFAGNVKFRQSLAKFLEKRIFKRAVDAQNLHLTNGVASAVEGLCFALCEPDDCIIIPTPLFPGFLLQCTMRPKCKVVYAHRSSKDNYRLTTECLEAAFKEAQAQGYRVRMLLVANPDNPTGIAYPKEDMTAALKWADSKPDLHFVSDEIYALSSLGEQRFTSVVELLPNGLGDRVHVLWGFSKDFCMSGLRVGVTYSEDTEVLAGLASFAHFTSISGREQNSLRQLVEEGEFMDDYLKVNAESLLKAYKVAERELQLLDVPYIVPQSGFFVWANFSKFMPEQTEDAVQKLWSKLFFRAKVNLIPGLECKCMEPGWFRICFSAYPNSAISLAFQRMTKVLNSSDTETDAPQ